MGYRRRAGLEGTSEQRLNRTPAEVMEVLSRDYFPSYAVAAWTLPVHVTRVARYA